MKLSLSTSLVAIIGALALATASSAATSNRDNNGDARGASVAQSFPSFANPAPAASGFKSTAKVAAFVQAGGTLLRSINVKSLTHPATGVYCVAPTTKLDMSAIYPQVTVEYGTSDGQSLLAYIEQSRNDCPKTSIEVQTYDFNSGTIEISNDISFFLYID